MDNGYPNAAFSTDFVQPLREVLVVKRKLQYRKGGRGTMGVNFRLCKIRVNVVIKSILKHSYLCKQLARSFNRWGHIFKDFFNLLC